ncbi:MAG: polymer-forming cytoskeletal protein [Comamonadaceae bacterium]|nr:polymer-forming cytoskeletal protein [Comamonadaceae bacterium]
MFSKSKQPPIRSLIAEGCHVHGDISFADGIRIDGTVEGTLSGDEAKSKKGTLVFVSEHGRVSGGIQADTIIVNGVVEGPLHAALMLDLQPKARVNGDVSYRQLEMHQGALISGRMQPILSPAVSAAEERGAAAQAAPPGTPEAARAAAGAVAARTPQQQQAPAQRAPDASPLAAQDNPLQALDALDAARRNAAAAKTSPAAQPSKLA